MIYAIFMFVRGDCAESWATASLTEHVRTMNELHNMASAGSWSESLGLMIEEYTIRGSINHGGVEPAAGISWRYDAGMERLAKVHERALR